MSRYAFFCLMLFLLAACGGGRPLPQRLQPVVVRPVTPEIIMQQDFYATEDSLHITLKFEDVQQVRNLQEAAFALEYEVRAGRSQTNPLLLEDSLSVSNRKETAADGQLFLTFALPQGVVKEPNVLFLRLWQRLAGQERVQSRFSLELLPKMLDKKFLVVMANSGKPLTRDYLTFKDKLLVKQFGTQADSILNSFKVSYYNLEVTPSLPPMSTRQTAVPTAPASSDTLRFSTNDTIQFQKEGVYLLASDTEHQKGILVQKWSYPLVTMTEEMLQPLIYLTTSEERQALFSAKDVKSAIDGFWLKVADGNRSLARDLIRTFYGRVEEANRRFSSYKPGWATDRGMIYIIYGRPSNISRVGVNESWVYRESETSPYIKFVFTKKENNFTENHYELVRRREYEESWYNTVAQWRAGITDM